MKNFSSPENSEIVFFDGVCNLCNASVDFIIRHNSTMLMAPLQGKTAARMLPAEMIKGLPSIVFYDHGRTYTASSAALRIFKKIGGIYSLLFVFILVPPLIRNYVYQWIARNRYSWFGKRETCRLPTEQERKRFLD